MVEETVEQIKDMQVIERLILARHTLEKAGEHPIIVQNLIDVINAMYKDYTTKYPQPAEADKDVT